MSLDPYGYPTDREPEPPAGRSALLVFAVAGACLAAAGCCSGGGVLFIGTTEDVGYDAIGPALLLSAPAWPAAGAGLATVGLYLALRRGWVAAGPNLLLGGLGGCLAWAVAFLGVVILASLSR